MTQSASLIIEIPYREDTAHYVERFLHLPGCIFFDSGHPQAERGRYDIFSADPLYSLRYTNGLLTQTGQDPQLLNGNQLISTLNALLKRHQVLNQAPREQKNDTKVALPFTGGFAGYFSYDLARCWEQLPMLAVRDIDVPELMLGFYLWAGVIDHQLKRAWLSFLPECPAELQEKVKELTNDVKAKFESKKFNIINKLKSQFNVNSYKENILKIQEYILNGDCYQVNYSQRFDANYEGHSWSAYQTLRKFMAAPYGAYFQFKYGNLGEDSAILCYSPERFVEVKGNLVLTQPIKGTITRHPDPEQDAQNANNLLSSEKNRAENLMIVDLLRNDLGKACDYGSIKAENLFELQSVSNVHHLVSSITGHLRDGYTTFDLLKATLPGGSITGAPKIRSMQIIEALEPSRRSVYCGVMAYIDINGNMDSNIIIRTVLCHQGKIYCWGGGGIVADSDWKQEYEESLIKINPLLKGLESIN